MMIFLFRKKSFFLLLSLVVIGLGPLGCGLFKKKKKPTSAETSDSRFPAGWDLLTDWTGGEWSVDDL